MSELTRTDKEVKNLARKIYLARYIVAIFFLIITSRLWYLQIVKGPHLRMYSENNYLKKQKVVAPRGVFLSRNNKVLASNQLQLELQLTPQYSADIQKVSQEIAPIIKIPSERLEKNIIESKKYNGLFYPVTLKKQLSINQVFKLKRLREFYPEININEYIIRFYPLGERAFHVLGYMGEVSKQQLKKWNYLFDEAFYFKSGDVIGQNGIEQIWERNVRGHDGVNFIEVDAYSRHILHPSKKYLWNLKPQKYIPGHHLVLTIDEDIQNAAFKAMNRKDAIGPRNGAVVVMKTNGEILALVSSPSYDPNKFSAVLSSESWKEIRKQPSKLLLNKAIQNHYPPGSIIKPFVTFAALQEGLLKPDTLINSPSRIRVGRRIFHDHKQTGYGEINLFQAIEESSNTFFYQIGRQLGMDKMASYFKLFGLGEKTKIKLPGEIFGFIPTSRWKEKTFNKKWQKGEDLVHAIGQGYILVTPLQVAIAFNAIATKGKIVRPFLVRRIVNSKDEVVKEFVEKRTNDLSEYIDTQHFETVQKALTQVVHGPKGTARWWKVKGYKMAGKTGTSQVHSFKKGEVYKDCRQKEIQRRNHGWFVAFAPVEKPEIVVSVLTEHSCFGSSGSAPVARDIIRAYLKKYSQAPRLSTVQQKLKIQPLERS